MPVSRKQRVRLGGAVHCKLDLSIVIYGLEATLRSGSSWPDKDIRSAVRARSCRRSVLQLDSKWVVGSYPCYMTSKLTCSSDQTFSERSQKTGFIVYLKGHFGHQNILLLLLSSSFLVTGFLSSQVLLLLSLLSQKPLRLQVSACSTFLMMCDVPITIIIIIMYSCHRFSLFPGTSPLEPVVNPTTQASSLSL
jgi:hypothetical protein